MAGVGGGVGARPMLPGKSSAPSPSSLKDPMPRFLIDSGSSRLGSVVSRRKVAQQDEAHIELIRGDMKAPSGLVLSLSHGDDIRVTTRGWSRLELPDDELLVSFLPQSVDPAVQLAFPRTKPIVVRLDALSQGRLGTRKWGAITNVTISPEITPVQVVTMAGVPIEGALLEVSAPTGPGGEEESLAYPCNSSGISAPALLGNESLSAVFGTLRCPSLSAAQSTSQQLFEYTTDFFTLIQVNSKRGDDSVVELGFTRLDLPSAATEMMRFKVGKCSKSDLPPGMYRVTCSTPSKMLLDPAGDNVGYLDIPLGVDGGSVRVALAVSDRDGGGMEIVDAETGDLLEEAWIAGELYMPRPGPNPAGEGEWLSGYPRHQLERRSDLFVLPSLEGYLPEDLSQFRLLVGSTGYGSAILEDCSWLASGSSPTVSLRKLEMIPLTVESSTGQPFNKRVMIQEDLGRSAERWSWPSDVLMVPRDLVGRDVRLSLVGEAGGRQPIGVYPIAKVEEQAVIMLPTSTIRIVGLPEGVVLSASPGSGVSYDVEAKDGASIFDAMPPGLWFVGSPAAVQDQVMRRLQDSQAIVPGVVCVRLVGSQIRQIDSAQIGVYGTLSGSCEVVGFPGGDVKIAPFYSPTFDGHHGGTIPGLLRLDPNGAYEGGHPTIIPSWVVALAPVGVGQFPGDTIVIGVSRPLRDFTARVGSLEISSNSTPNGSTFVQITPRIMMESAGAPIVLEIPDGTSRLIPVLPEGSQTLTLLGTEDKNTTLDFVITAGETTLLSL